MRLIINQNADSAAEWAAKHIINRINAFSPSAGNPFVLGLPTGSTPLGVYKKLIAACKQGEISFAHVVTFNMDEYAGLPAEHPESYYSFMYNNFFNFIDIKRENINLLDGCAPDLAAECERYEAKIKAVGGIDLFMGGIGVDGHIAFNEPGSSLQGRTHCQGLTQDTKIANSRFFGNDPAQVPSQALTVGVGTICDSREVMILAFGHGKARALRHTIEEPVSHVWTASALQLHANAIAVADEAACAELTVGFYKYFKEIEAANKAV